MTISLIHSSSSPALPPPNPATPRAPMTAGHKLGAADLRDRIMTAVEAFTCGEPYDDATLMVVRVE